MYSLESSLKLRRNLYQSGDKIIYVQTPFLATVYPGIIGAGLLLWSALGAITYYIESTSEPLLFIWMGAEALAGLYFAKIALNNRSLREENGGLHPKDSLYLFDAGSRELLRFANGIEERLAGINEVQFSVEIHKGQKTTTYFPTATWPTGKVRMTSSRNHADAEATLSELRKHFSFPETVVG